MVIVKVATILPLDTVTLTGTVATDLLLDKETTTPPVGAGALSVTVPIDGLPPTTVVGLSVSEFNWTDVPVVTVKVDALVIPA